MSEEDFSVKIGVTFPATAFGGDSAAIRDFAQAVEGAGFQHLRAAEHVIGGHPDRVPAGERVHTHDVVYREPFVLFGYIGAVTQRLELVTSILILPQRQTVLVAKQAAELDLLTGGRLRLGVGLGRNWMEYEALNEDFHNRGRRIEEQIEVLRRLWTEDLVTFDGTWHHLDRMGLNPMPVQRPIPIWMGTYTQLVERPMKRVARIADGWFPQFPPNDEFRVVLERFRGYIEDAGRDPAAVGIDVGVNAGRGGPEEWIAQAKAWEELGATHLTVGTMGAGFTSPREHLDAILRCKEALDSR